MEKNVSKEKKSRNGLHKKGRVRMGIYTSPFRKAVAVVTSRKICMTMTDLVWHGIESVAKAHGILDSEGKVTERFKNEIDLETTIVSQSEVNG